MRPVFGFGHQQTRQESAQSHREPSLLGEPADPQDHQQHDAGEELRRPIPCNQAEQRAKREASEGEDDDQGCGGFQECATQSREDARLAAGEERHQREQWHHGQVLQQQHGEGDPAMRRAQFAPLHQDLEHDGRRGECQARPHNEGRTAIEPQCSEARPEDQRGHHHLGRPEPEHISSERYEPLDRKLQPNRKQQEHHAELAQDRRCAHIPDQAKAVGTDECSRHEVAQDRAYAQPVEDGNDHHRREEDDQDIA